MSTELLTQSRLRHVLPFCKVQRVLGLDEDLARSIRVREPPNQPRRIAGSDRLDVHCTSGILLNGSNIGTPLLDRTRPAVVVHHHMIADPDFILGEQDAIVEITILSDRDAPVGADGEVRPVGVLRSPA